MSITRRPSWISRPSCFFIDFSDFVSNATIQIYHFVKFSGLYLKGNLHRRAYIDRQYSLAAILNMAAILTFFRLRPYPKIFSASCFIIVPSFMLVTRSAQFREKYSQIGGTIMVAVGHYAVVGDCPTFTMKLTWYFIIIASPDAILMKFQDIFSQNKRHVHMYIVPLICWLFLSPLACKG